MKTNRNIKGFTLLETLLVLVIIIAIILIAGRYYNQATESSKLSTTISKVKKITEASYEWVKIAKTFDSFDPNDPKKRTLSIQTLKDENLLSPNDDANPWGGTALQVASVNANKIRITISGVPTKVCTVFVDHLKPQNMDVLGCSTVSGTGTTTTTIDYPKDAT